LYDNVVKVTSKYLRVNKIGAYSNSSSPGTPGTPNTPFTPIIPESEDIPSEEGGGLLHPI